MKNFSKINRALVAKKKIFLFVAAIMTAATMSAESVYQWGAGVAANQIGSQTYAGSTVEATVKIDVDKTTVPCIKLANGYKPNGAAEPVNYIEITAKEGSFLADDVVIIEFCYNNKDDKNALVSVCNPADYSVLGTSGKGKNGRYETGVTKYTYQLTEAMQTIQIARGEATNVTATCITSLRVARGETIVEEPIAPAFSVLTGTYYEPFKVAIESSNTTAVFYSINDGEFHAYSDSLEITESVKIAAYAELNDLRSETVVAEYEITEFIPRTVFKARHTLSFAGLKAEDITLLDESVAKISIVTGEETPCVDYINQKSTKLKSDGVNYQDSTMCVSFKSMPDVKFIYSNSADKAGILRLYPEYVQAHGKGFELHIDSLGGLIQPNDTIVFVVTAREDGTKPKFDHKYSSSSNIDAYEPEEGDLENYTDGSVDSNADARIDNDYSGWTNLVYIVKPTKKYIKIKETANGYRIAHILIGAYRVDASQEGLQNESIAPKAVKTIENGQLVIIKNGVRYNALGAQL